MCNVKISVSHQTQLRKPFSLNRKMLRSFIAFCAIIVNSSILNVYQVMLFIFVRPFHRPLYKRCISDVIVNPWINIMSSIFPPSKLVISGDMPDDVNRPCIIIANHQVDADWWYIWQVATLANGAGNIKVVLKDGLKNVPILGWGMQLMDFIFLKRDIKKDKKRMEKRMMEFSKDGFPYWMVLFPEGTTIHTEYVEKSHCFAEKQKRPRFKRVLLPRTTGLQVLLDAVQNCPQKPDIYDITMAYSSYSGEVPTYKMGYGRNVDKDIPSIQKLVSGNGTREVHIVGRKCSYDQVFQNTEKWLDDAWAKKEARMNQFIDTQKLTMTAQEESTQRQLSIPCSYSHMIRLWGILGMSCFILPLMVFFFFPCYVLWVTYRVCYAVYDKGTNTWLPYMLFVITGKKSTTQEIASL